MGIYIGMEMPKPGEVIRIYNNGEARRCRVTEQKAFEVGVAIPVPPHGRLVDADKLSFDMMDAANADQALAMVDDAPTVLEAEEQSGNSGELED